MEEHAIKMTAAAISLTESGHSIITHLFSHDEECDSVLDEHMEHVPFLGIRNASVGEPH